MKTTIQTITCHSKPSLRACREVISKLPHLLIFFFLCTYTSFAQQYEWDWAFSGGGTQGADNIYDVKVGTDGNYYFIGKINGTAGTQIDGTNVDTYNYQATDDIFIFSTTCDGTIRWSQTIGGGNNDYAYNLVLDSNNNVYVGAFVISYINYLVHFSPTNSVAVSDPDYNKTLYLVKYDSNGVFQAQKALQGGTATDSFLDGFGILLDLAIDSQDHLHFVVGLLKGTHLDGNVTVPSNYVYDPVNYKYTIKYYLAEYESTLNYVNSMELPISDDSLFPLTGTTRFAYDETKNQYYLAGMRSDGVAAPIVPLIYDGNAFMERSYILAIDGTDGSEVWRREIRTNAKPNTEENNITSLIIDANSDVYISARLWASSEVSDKSITVFDPLHSKVLAYTFTPKVTSNIPALIKFNSNTGAVQWVKTPDGRTANFSTSSTSTYVKGLAIRGNEIAMGAFSCYFIWDSFQQNYPIYTLSDGSIVRFNKQTGKVVGMHDIDGIQNGRSQTTALAVDNDGNYVVGGNFNSILFSNTANVSTIYSSGGEDFFVAKLAASVCGTTVSTEEFNTITVNVFPNPTANIVNVETTEPLAGYIIYDALGRMVRESVFGNSNQINLETASNGVYFIKVTTQNGNVGTVKVVKQ